VVEPGETVAIADLQFMDLAVRAGGTVDRDAGYQGATFMKLFIADEYD
jgi:hypothetical protein